jgi:hypothetical protein
VDLLVESSPIDSNHYPGVGKECLVFLECSHILISDVLSVLARCRKSEDRYLEFAMTT